MNNVTLLGRLVRNADFNKFDNNAVARFTLAVDKGLSKEKKKISIIILFRLLKTPAINTILYFYYYLLTYKYTLCITHI